MKRTVIVDKRGWQRKTRQLILVIIITIIVLSPAAGSLIGVAIVTYLRKDVQHIIKY